MDVSQNIFIVPQSGLQTGTITFRDGQAPSTDVTMVANDDRERVYDPELDLSKFLERPVLIQTLSWGNTLLSPSFNPWALFLQNKRVINRLTTFNLIKGTLHLKFMVNGNSFLYGRAMVSYLPLQSFDGTSQISGLVPQNRIQLSQMPRLFLDPTTSQGGTMTLPFFYPEDYINMKAATYLEMGEIIISQIAGLKNANAALGVGDVVPISVYAWMTDAVLGGPTNNNAYHLVPQAGEEVGDKQKIVSQTATAVADAAGALKKLPVIKPYATAAEMGARTVSKIASALGYCRPLNINPPGVYVPRMMSTISETNTTDISTPLSTDFKQGVTVDSKSVGVNFGDEMDILKLCQVESFLCTFGWGEGTTPKQLLGTIVVCPSQFDVVTGPPAAYHMTAICGVSQMFKYWTGSIKFRIQVIASAFHRGRLAVVYDSVDSSQGFEENIQKTDIIDISTDRDFSISISNHQPKAYLDVPDMDSGVYFGTTPRTAVDGGNGTLSLYVLNPLTVPTPDPVLDKSITIAVYVSAGDDFELAVPNLNYPGGIDEYMLQPQSGADPIETVVPEEEAIDSRIEHPLPARDTLLYIGEKMVSLRQLMHRYAPGQIIGFDETDVGGFKYTAFSTQPLNRGCAEGIHTRVTPGDTSYVAMSPFTWMRNAFSGKRGAMRWKFEPMRVESSQMDHARIIVSRFDGIPSLISSGVAVLPQTTQTAISKTYCDRYHDRACMNGIEVANSEVNGALEVQFPYYSQYKFIPGKQINYANGNDYIDSMYITQFRSGTLTRVWYKMYYATGEDFSFLFFTGFPPVYKQVNLL